MQKPASEICAIIIREIEAKRTKRANTFYACRYLAPVERQQARRSVDYLDIEIKRKQVDLEYWRQREIDEQRAAVI